MPGRKDSASSNLIRLQRAQEFSRIIYRIQIVEEVEQNVNDPINHSFNIL